MLYYIEYCLSKNWISKILGHGKTFVTILLPLKEAIQTHNHIAACVPTQFEPSAVFKGHL